MEPEPHKGFSTPYEFLMERTELHIKQFSGVKLPYDRINLKTKSNHLLKKHTEPYRVAPLL